MTSKRRTGLFFDGPFVIGEEEDAVELDDCPGQLLNARVSVGPPPNRANVVVNGCCSRRFSDASSSSSSTIKSIIKVTLNVSEVEFARVFFFFRSFVARDFFFG